MPDFTSTTRVWKTFRGAPWTLRSRHCEGSTKSFQPCNASGLDLTTQGDLALILSNIHSTLLTLETVRPWEKNPDVYSTGITSSIFTLMERKFASPDERLRSAVAREKQMPAVLEAARVNLKNPPRIYTEIAIEQLPGDISFFQNDVPAAFKDATDAATRAQFEKTNAAVIAALQRYEEWLKTEVLPKFKRRFPYRRGDLFKEAAV